MVNKKAQGLSLNVVILSILALIVLAVFVFLLFQQTGNFDESTRCSNRGGICMDEGANCIGTVESDSDLCAGEDRVCCVLR